MCARSSSREQANGHHLLNETAEDVVYLEIGDRTLRRRRNVSGTERMLQATLVQGK